MRRIYYYNIAQNIPGNRCEYLSIIRDKRLVLQSARSSWVSRGNIANRVYSCSGTLVKGQLQLLGITGNY